MTRLAEAERERERDRDRDLLRLPRDDRERMRLERLCINSLTSWLTSCLPVACEMAVSRDDRLVGVESSTTMPYCSATISSSSNNTTALPDGLGATGAGGDGVGEKAAEAAEKVIGVNDADGDNRDAGDNDNVVDDIDDIDGC